MHARTRTMAPRGRRGLACGAIALGAAIAVAAIACIPDLDMTALPATDAGSESSSNGAVCGDGFIDLEHGEECDPGAQPSMFCAGCRVACPDGFVLSTNHHCYFEVAQAGSIEDANNACASSGGGAHIATFASDAEWDAVTTYARRFDGGVAGGKLWIGLQKSSDLSLQWIARAQDHEPGWEQTTPQAECTGCYARVDDPDAGFTRILRDGGAIEQSCVTGSSLVDAQWAEKACGTPGADAGPNALARVVCEREPVGSLLSLCNEALCFYLVQTFPSKRYLYLQQQVDPDSAAAACVALGGHLVILESRDEREQLWHELASRNPYAIWIGLSLQDAGWIWDDGVPASDRPSPWGTKEPAAAGLPRAFLRNPGPFSPDTQLAHTDVSDLVGTDGGAPFVCEVPPDAGAR